MERSGRLCLALAVVVLVCGLPASTRAQAPAVPPASTAAEPMTLRVDETQAARRLAFVHEEIPVTRGPLQLAYPKWIPGEHGPTGPIQQLADLRIRARSQSPSGAPAAATTSATNDGQLLAWTRDPDDIYTIRVDVPAGVSRLTVDFAIPVENTISDHQLLMPWHTVVLYPLGIDKKDLQVRATLMLPKGWRYATSLKELTSGGGDSTRGNGGAVIGNGDAVSVAFAPVSLERLIDSPVLAGEFLRSEKLTSQWPAMLHVTGDSAAAVEKAVERAGDTAGGANAVQIFSKLVDEDRAMFGFRHFETLHILVSQSDADPYDGLEHADAPYNGVPDAGLSKASDLRRLGAPVLAHEQSHSWVGKYRRPAELYSKPHYQGPERTSLLWVYEGLNTLVATVLATRAGFNDAAYARDQLAAIAAQSVHQPARASVALVDTATEAWVLRGVPGGWTSLRRGQDFYQQGAMVWLEADAIIRTQSKGQRSLGDFLRAFFGQRDTGPIVLPYTRADVEVGLSAIVPYDWHGFFESRIYQVNPEPAVSALAKAGWRLVYNDTPSLDRFWMTDDPRRQQMYSIGLQLAADNSVADVLLGSPAYGAGLGPRMVITAVNGETFTIDRLLAAIAHPVNGKVTLVVRNFSSVQTVTIDYAGGLRYPHLERIPDSPDHLTDILKPRVP